MTRQAVTHRSEMGLKAYLSGASAEQSVVLTYERAGLEVLEQRWRGQGGEIDLILRDGETIVFVEVKKASSFDRAITRLKPAQMQRIHVAASEFLAYVPDGQLSDVRFDLAAVDGTGQVQITENAFAHF